MSGRKPPDEFALYKGDLLVAVGRRDGGDDPLLQHTGAPPPRFGN